MGRRCTVCAHPERDAIDTALASGIPYRKIAESFGLSESALSRHKSNHLSQTIRKAEEAARVEVAKRHEVEDLEHALDVVRQLKQINEASKAVLARAMKAQDGDLALKAVDRVHRQIELQAKLIGELDERPTVNVLVSPEWIKIEAVLLAALRPFPEARVAAARALEELESAGG